MDLKQFILSLLVSILVVLVIAQDDSCFTEKQESGYCTNITDCRPMLDKIAVSNFTVSQLIYYLLSSRCQNSLVLVCCPLQKTDKAQQIYDDDDYHVLPAQGAKIIEDYDDESESNNILPTYPNCGYNKLTSSTRIIGGRAAQRGEFPWLVLLGFLRDDHQTVSFTCGGSLITYKHVLTAAHCIYEKKNLYSVRVGDLDVYNDTDGTSPENIGILKAVYHSGFTQGRFKHDIAVLTLKTSADPNRGVWPICLPLEDDQKHHNYLGHHPIIAGWGSTEFDGKSSSILQKVMLPIVPSKICEKAYVKMTGLQVDHNMLCAGYMKGEKDACTGDSGGPLMLRSESPDRKSLLYYQIGIVSYGYKCAEPGYPGVYTKVANYIDWIERQIQ